LINWLIRGNKNEEIDRREPVLRFNGNYNIRMDSHFRGDDRRRSGNNASEARLHWAGIKESGMTYERVLVEN